MRRFFKNNGLSLTMLALFLFSLMGQSLSGWLTYNEEQREHMQAAVSYLEYLVNHHFLEAVFENWESEFLQMAAFVALTVFLRQKGSPESKPIEGKQDVDEIKVTADSPAAVKRGGWMLRLYQNSLSLALFALFLISFGLHAISGAAEYNAEQLEHGGELVSVAEYLGSARFWYESFQNWQSEFLSIGVLVVLAVYLRQKGSPESKPVGAAHSEHE